MSKLDFLKKAVPWLATVAEIALPAAAPLIGVASKILATKLGKPVPASADAIGQTISDMFGDPAQHQALLESEQAFQQSMQQMGYQHETDMAAIAEKDRESARALQTATHSWIPGFLAVGVTVGFFGLLSIMIFRAAPPGSEKVLDIMVGSLATAWVAIVMFYFGSSSGSERKTELLANGGHN